MKISDVNNEGQITQLVQQTGKSNQAEKTAGPPAKPNAGEDTVNLSPEAKEFRRIHEILAATSPVRPEKVAAVKTALENGEYRVRDEALADSIVKDALPEFNKQG